jgi:hypothetical protein
MHLARPFFGLILLSIPAAAQTRIFFTEYKFNDPKLETMALDGSSLSNLFAPANPFPSADWLPLGIAVDAAAGKLYWSHGSFNDGRIRRANLDGSGQQTLLSSLKLARGLALDLAGGKMYWADSPAAGNAGGLIERANLDGSGRETVFAITPYDPFGSKIGRPTVDSVNGWVWFGADDAILRVNLNGPPFVARTVVTGLSTPTRVQVDVASGWVYGIDSDTISDCVWRARMDGSGFEVVVDSTPGSVESSGLLDLEIDRTAGRLYVADEIGNTVIQRANLDGSSLATIFTSQSGWVPAALAFDTAPGQALEDCNHNGVRDLDDIQGGVSSDCNVNGIPDECEGADPCAPAACLVQQALNTAPPQRALGGTAPGTGWIVFQPFDVPAGGWQIGAVTVDGYTTNWAAPGFTVTLFPDTGSNYPNEAQPLAAGSAHFRFAQTPIEVPLAANLPAGRHWLRLTASTTYTAAVYTATNGLPSFSRSNLGNDFPNQPPISLCVSEARRFSSFCAGDGSATTCPCANAGATGRGCASSVPAFGALLAGHGLASVSVDTVVLTATGLPNGSSALFFQGTIPVNGGLGAVFGDGLRCAGGTITRLSTKSVAGGSAVYPTGADPSVSVRGQLPQSGGTRHYQVWYRNAAAFCTSATFNLTNGLTAAWSP